MNFLVISTKDLAEYSEAFEYLSDKKYNCYHSDNINNIPKILFDFYIIDEAMSNIATTLLNIPFLINVSSLNYREYLYNNKNFLGFIDLKSNPISIWSYLKSINKDIKIYNDSYTGRLLKERFIDSDMSFFDTLPHGLVFMDNNAEILHINPVAEDILSCSKGQITGVNVVDKRWTFYNDDGSILKPYNHPGLVAMKTRKKIKDYILGISKEGEDIIWVKATCIPIIKKNNQSELVYIYFRDYSVEKKEHEYMQLYLSVFNHSNLSIVITDNNGIIESVNKKFMELTGYNKKELIGRSTKILKSKESLIDYKTLWETIKSGKTWSGEFINKKKSGELYSLSGVISPLKNREGKITHFIGLKENISDLKNTQYRLEKTLKHLKIIIAQKTESLNSAQALTLESLATLSEYRDNETGAHIKRTKLYVKLMLEKIREKLTLDDDDIFQIWSSAPLHDIGKVAIPDSILLKNGKLTSEEFEIMKGHVRHGNEALIRVSEGKDDDSYLKYAKEITLFHHEKWDGSGYPYGLTSKDIPISARLMALADVYDALRSTRPYKDPIEHETVVEMIKSESGRHFDPELVDVFIKYHYEFDNIFIESTENVFDFMEF